MRRLIVTALVALCLPATAGAQTIYVVNQSSVPDAAVQAALPGFQLATSRDFAPVWHTDATLVVSQTPPVGAETITLSDNVDCFCGGYHGEGPSGPYAMVFPSMGGWQVTFSHELFEMLVDPFPWSAPRAVHTAKGWLLVEVGDPVEAASYRVLGTRISDFVTPAWYTGGRYRDRMWLTRQKLEIRKGGYQFVWAGGQWAPEVW